MGNAARQSDSQGTVTMMFSPLYRQAEIARFAYSDNIVGRLGEFPELTQAVREGDLETVRFLCEQLFSSTAPIYRPKARTIAA